MIFDDVSFLGASANKKQIEILKKAMSEVRHLEGGIDVRIISIFNIHYSYGIDKAIRGSNFSFYTSVASNEMENMQKVLGIQNTSKIESFQKMTQQALLKKKYASPISNKKWFVYDYRQPFAPSLFYNSVSLRVIAFPKREWIKVFFDFHNNFVLVGDKYVQRVKYKEGMNGNLLFFRKDD